MQVFKNEVINLVEQITGLKKEKIIVLLEHPSDPSFGDLSLPCFSLTTIYKKNPADIAKSLMSDAIVLKKSTIRRIDAKGPYLNFFINYNEFAQLILKTILREKQHYGRLKGKEEKIMIEYSSPNINKPLHIGHLRNDSLGMSLSNILGFSNRKVIRTAVINDRGVHICKSMLAYKKWGNNKTPQSTNTKSDHFVGSFYVLFEQKLKENPNLEREIHDMLNKWENNDRGTRELWKKMNTWVLAGMKKTYALYGSKFDFWTFESNIYDKAKEIVNEGIKKNIFSKNEKGDYIVDLEPELPNKVVLRSDGTSVYITQDIALAELRFKKYKIKRLIYVVASEQVLHFKQLFRILSLLGYDYCKDCYHLSYGLVNLPTGRMKTREGTVVDADDLIEQEIELAKKEILQRNKNIKKKELEENSLKIALSAIKYYLLKTDPIKDILFDSEKAIRFEGDTGPYVLYTIARCNSLLEKTKESKERFLSIEINDEESQIIKKLSLFQDILEKATTDLKPSYICVYTSELATLFNNFYEKHRVIDIENNTKGFRIAIVKSTKQVLEICLHLLNIQSVKHM